MLLKNLLEKFTQPHRVSKIQKLKQINDQHPNDDLYVHYSLYDKLGINPRSKFKTPIGIYSYPMDYMLDIGGKPPYAGDRPYMVIFKVLDKSNVWDMSPDELTISKEKLKLIGLDNDYKNDEEVWKAIRMKAHTQSSKRPTIMFRELLLKMGIDGVTDLDDRPIIAGQEPVQAVFFDIRKLKVVSILDNKPEIAGSEKALRALSRAIKKKKGVRLNKQTEQWILDNLDNIFPGLPEFEKRAKLGLLTLYARRNVEGRWHEFEKFLDKYGSEKDIETYYSADYGIG